MFDWDGTAVPDREADASELRRIVESLCAAGMHVAVVSGTHVANVDGQLRARPDGPGLLALCVNRGSEVFLVDRGGPRLVARREATPRENALLDAAAHDTIAQLAALGLKVAYVGDRFNRRKIDLIPVAAWRNPRKAEIAALLAAVEARLRAARIARLGAAVRVAEAAAARVGLPDARVTSDAKHVEVGLTDKGDAARWIFAELWRRGVGASQVLVAGDEVGALDGAPGSDSRMTSLPEARRATTLSVGAEPGGVPEGVIAIGGGPTAFLEVLEDQLARRLRGELPAATAEPGWSIAVEGFHAEYERAHESLLAIGDGVLGTRGAPVVACARAAPAVHASGLYDGEGAESKLLACPIWNQLGALTTELDGLLRVLDLRTGLLHQRVGAGRSEIGSVSFASLASPGVVALRAELSSSAKSRTTGDALARPLGLDDRIRVGRSGEWQWMRVDASPCGGVVSAARQSTRAGEGDRTCVDRVAAFVADVEGVPELQTALARGSRAGDLESLLVEHREAWGRRWEDVDVVIEGDDEIQRALRFALFHLMASVHDEGEAAVGARGLSGPAYFGHVFWDSDVFVLPFLAATHPAAARAMLEYRVRRLPAALEAAKPGGHRGARFPWESARSGRDVTPHRVRDAAGHELAIRTGEQEEHIVADVAWGAACYLDWTADEEFARGPGAALLVETARYWASRVRRDADGRGHIDRVIGPDEYHEAVDDNAFTNVMARWNLARAARHVADYSVGVAEEERAVWLDIAASLVDGFDPETGLYEQFRGFYALEPLIAEDTLPRRPVAADLLLGRERVARAQVVKQADVLLLYDVVPDEMRPDTLEANLRHYEPRTAHGSSLSPAMHVPLFARTGDWERAMRWLRVACRLDLADLTGTTAGGLHLATMGGLWQAIASGFAGLRPGRLGLRFEPRLPPSWRSLEVRVRFRGVRLRARIERDQARLEADDAVPIVLGAGEVLRAGPGTTELERRDARWEVSRS